MPDYIEDINNGQGKEQYTSRAEENIFRIPTSPAQYAVLQVLNTGGSDNKQSNLIKYKNSIRGSELEIRDEGTRKFDFTSNNAEVTVAIDDIKLLEKNSGAARDFFILLLIKIAQNIHNGIPNKLLVTITPREIIDLGLYSNSQTAKQSFDKAGEILTSIKISGRYKAKSNNYKSYTTDSSLRVLFIGTDSIYGQYTIYLNPLINWELFLNFITPLPKFYFKLARKAKDLLYYIFYMARVNSDKIAKSGKFNISYRAIQAFLGLPSEKNNRYPQRTILEPIEKAITEIEDANFCIENKRQFTITPYPALDNPDKLPIKDLLDKGYIQVGISGNYAIPYKELYSRQKKHIKSRAKKPH